MVGSGGGGCLCTQPRRPNGCSASEASARPTTDARSAGCLATVRGAADNAMRCREEDDDDEEVWFWESGGAQGFGGRGGSDAGDLRGLQRATQAAYSVCPWSERPKPTSSIDRDGLLCHFKASGRSRCRFSVGLLGAVYGNTCFGVNNNLSLRCCKQIHNGKMTAAML